MTLYSIKPIRWEACRAATPVGVYIISLNWAGRCYWRLETSDEHQFATSRMAWVGSREIADAEADAERDYRARLLAALHPEGPPDDPS